MLDRIAEFFVFGFVPLVSAFWPFPSLPSPPRKP